MSAAATFVGQALRMFSLPYYSTQVGSAFVNAREGLEHYLVEGHTRGLSPHHLFDVRFYEAQLDTDLAPDVSPLEHYLVGGGDDALTPHPLFSPSHYARQLERCDLMAATGTEDAAPLRPTLLHYLTDGAGLGANPHPLFDTAFYLRHAPGLAKAGGNPLEHYVAQGATEGRAPNPLYDVAHVRTQLDSTDGGLLAYLDAYANGHIVAPNPLLDPSWYQRVVGPDQDVGEPLTHFLESGAQDGQPLSSQHKHLLRSLRWAPRPPLVRGSWRQGTVCVVSHSAEPSGASLVALELVRQLAEVQRLKVTVILLKGGELSEQFRTHAWRFAQLSEMLAHVQPDSASFRAALKSILPTAPLATFVNSAAASPVIDDLHRLGYPVVALARELCDNTNAHQFEALTRADTVVVPSESVASTLEHLDFDRRKVRVTEPGLLRPDFGSIDRKHARADVRRRLGIADADLIVLGCGVASPRKGIDLFGVMAHLVLGQRSEDDRGVHFVWVGGEPTAPDTGDTTTPWTSTVADPSFASHHIHFVGVVEDAEEYFAAADVFYLPSRRDAFPNVGLEAMASSLPIVAFNQHNGVVEMLPEPNETCADYMDVATQLEQLQRLLGDAELRQRIGRRNKQAVKRFRFEDYTANLLDVAAAHDMRLRHRLDRRLEPTRGRKVLALCSNWALSGVNTALEALGVELRSRGIDFRIVFTEPREKVETSMLSVDGTASITPDVPYEFVDSTPWSGPEWYADVMSHLELHGPATVLTAYDFRANSVIPALSSNLKTMLWCQSDDPNYYEQVDRLGRYSDAIVTVSNHLATEVASINLAHEPKTRTIYNSSITAADITSARSKRDRPTDGPLRLIYAGRIVDYQKRCSDFVPFVDALEASGLDFSLTLVGDDPDGTCRSGLEERLSEHVARGLVRFTGRLAKADVADQLAAHDVFVLLSDFEGLSLSVVEAMAAGCVPLVKKMDSGVTELITDDETGLVMADRNYARWADRLLGLDRDRHRLQRMSIAAQEHVRAKHTVRASADAFEELIDELYEKMDSDDNDRPPVIRRIDAHFGDVCPGPLAHH